MQPGMLPPAAVASCALLDPSAFFAVPAALALWRVADGVALAARTLILRAARVDEPSRHDP
jgi:hypothetical protein